VDKILWYSAKGSKAYSAKMAGSEEDEDEDDN